MASLVTEALTQVEPQLQEQPGAAREDVSMDGKKQSDKVRPTHCEETGVCFGSRKASVLLPTRLRFSVVSYGKLAHSLGSGRKKGKVEGLEQFYTPTQMHGFGRLVGFFQSTRPEARALIF